MITRATSSRVFRRGAGAAARALRLSRATTDASSATMHVQVQQLRAFSGGGGNSFIGRVMQQVQDDLNKSDAYKKARKDFQE